MAQKVFITDFDGTMTVVDFFKLALEKLPEGAMEPWSRFEQGKCGHFQALQEIFAMLREDQASYDKILINMSFYDCASAALDTLHRADWQVEIASAGCSWYISRILKQHGIDIPLHANPGYVSEQGALIMQEPLDSPFYTPDIGINKGAVVNHYLTTGATVAYAGDGRPDLEPILMVPPEYRFATGWLAEELTRQGQQFTPFANWCEIADHLTERIN